MRYDVCGLHLESDDTFPELLPSVARNQEISLRLRRKNQIHGAGASLRPAARWTFPNGRPFLVSTKTQNGYLLRFIDLADFFVDEAGTEVEYSPEPGTPADSVRHLFLDTVFALVLSLRGHTVIHASAIVTPFGACAFAAESGTGKSTLAASFQKAGYPAVTDDCLLLEENEGQYYGRPSYPGVRLREDSLSLVGQERDSTLSVAHYNPKRRFTASPFASGRQPLAAIYCLERIRGHEDDGLSEPRIEPLSGHDGLLTVLRYLFCLDPHDPTMIVEQFRMLEHLLSRVPVLRLTIPDDFSALPRVHEAVCSDLKARSLTAAAPLQ